MTFWFLNSFKTQAHMYINIWDYLNGIYEIQSINTLYSIDPLQTQEGASKEQKTPFVHSKPT